VQPARRVSLEAIVNRRAFLKYGVKAASAIAASSVLSSCGSNSGDAVDRGQAPRAKGPADIRVLQSIVRTPVRRAGVNRVSFDIDGVTPASAPLPSLGFEDGLFYKLNANKRPLEGWIKDTPPLVEVIADARDTHPFLLAANLAYADHRPLTLSPDMIWLLLIQGLAAHINANPEKMRSSFVKHDGKKLLDVQLPASFVPGNRGNDWSGLIGSFSGMLRDHIGAETHGLVVSEFSTTGDAEKLAAQVALMDGMQSYFIFSATIICGIPTFTLEGTPDDWRMLRVKAAQLAKFDLEWWIPHVFPLLDACVDASVGKVDKAFWCDFYQIHTIGCGDQRIHGHIKNLFPYFGQKSQSIEELTKGFAQYVRDSGHFDQMPEAERQKMVEEFSSTLEQGGVSQRAFSLRRNPYIGQGKPGPGQGMQMTDVKTVLSQAPFIWNVLTERLQMEFVAGFIGASQDPKTFALRPQTGWAVRKMSA
jgi:hypothetical protein